MEHWINLNLTEHPPLPLSKTEAVGIGIFVLNKAHAVSSGFVDYILQWSSRALIEDKQLCLNCVKLGI